MFPVARPPATLPGSPPGCSRRCARPAAGFRRCRRCAPEHDRAGAARTRRRHVALERAVAVQVVRRDVGDDTDVWTGMQPRQLHFADLQHHHVLRGERADLVDQGNTQIAADQHAPPTLRLQHLAHQRGGGRLARAASDADDRCRRPLEEQLRMVRDDGPALRSFRNAGQLDLEAGRDAGTDEDDIGIGPRFGGVAPCHQAHRHAEIRHRSQHAGQLLFAAGICHGDACRALVGREPRQRGAFHPEPHQCNLLAAQLGRVCCHIASQWICFFRFHCIA